MFLVLYFFRMKKYYFLNELKIKSKCTHSLIESCQVIFNLEVQCWMKFFRRIYSVYTFQASR